MIRYLPETLINQIAAGEVIERPAAALKEIMENAIDAQATRIEVDVRDGGKTLIRVQDNGIGMTRDTLVASVDRHATSKLPDDDLLNIQHLGFRGEALPSIGAVSRLSIKSRAQGSNEAWEIKVEGGRKHAPAPTSLTEGTIVEVADLFYATPARLKFLKTDVTEFQNIRDIVTRLAMAYPHIGFRLAHNGHTSLNLQAAQGDFFSQQSSRLNELIEKTFVENAFHIHNEKPDATLRGFAGLPTYDRGTALNQYIFVNGRAVKDKQLLGAVRGAYADVMERNRYPVVALFLDVNPQEVDVNVHPAKAEVRFRDSAAIRNLIVGTIKHGLQTHGQKTSSSVSSQLWKTPPANNYARSGLQEDTPTHYMPLENSVSAKSEQPATEHSTATPLGAARAQFHENYILAQTEKGIVLVDQHAAHERLVYEKLKSHMEEGHIPSQGLLVPEVITLDDARCALLLSQADILKGMGLVIESFGANAISVQAVPTLLAGRVNVKKLIEDLADEFLEHGALQNLQEKINHVLATIACYGSVRSGRRMNVDEMNALLREMEKTPLSGQCNHGRPTYITLSLEEIEKLFSRR